MEKLWGIWILHNGGKSRFLCMGRMLEKLGGNKCADPTGLNGGGGRNGGGGG